jgi:uncharacterized protein YhaN
LVTTGDDTNSYSVLSQQLRDLRNRCRHNQTGLIPQCQARLREVNEALQSLQHVQSDVMALAAQQQLLLSQRAQTQQLLLRVRRAEDARAARQLREADSGVQEKEARVTRLRETCALLPQPEVLSQLRRKSQALADAQHTAAMEAAVAPPVPSAPQPPAVFRGLTPAQASQHAAADRDTVVHLSAAKMPNRLLPLLLCGLLVLAAAGLFFVSLPAGLIGLGTAAVLSAVCLLLLGRKAAAVRAQKAQALEILARYQAASPDELTVQAAAFAEAMECYEAEKEDALLQKQHLSEALAQAQAAANAFFAEISAFAPGCGSFADADYALRAADAAYAALGSAERELQQARSSLAQLRAIAGQPEESGGAEEDLSLYDARELRMQLDRTEGELQSVTSRLNLNRGRVMAMGDTVMLTAERDALCERLAALNRYNDALTVASEALERANNDLQSRFSPRIAALAGQIFSQLTDGRYEKLLLDRSLNIQAMESGDPILHPAAALSCGTVDQLDLSVHLAMAELLLPKQCPWILDDALINFDDTRAQRAMALLCEKAKERQILLFTCHDREQRLLASASDREAAHD